MFQQLIKAVSDWPVLVQGAIGSAIFWLVLLIGQKSASLIALKYSSGSKSRRKSFLLEQRLKYFYKTTTDIPARSAVFTALTYRAFRSFLKAEIWLILGLLGGMLVPSLSVIGYLGAIYYLFEALNTVTPVPDTDDPAGKIAEITTKLKKLGIKA